MYPDPQEGQRGPSLGRLEGDLLVIGAMEKGKQKDGKKIRVAVNGAILQEKWKCRQENR